MTIKTKDFIVIRVHDECGFDFKQGEMIREIIISCNATDFQYLNPGTFMIYFLKNIETDKLSEYLISKLNDLKLNEECFSNISVNKSEGPLIAEYSLFGKYKGGLLLGNTITKVMKNA